MAAVFYKGVENYPSLFMLLSCCIAALSEDGWPCIQIVSNSVQSYRMGVDQYDNGQLDDLFLTLVERCEGKILDDVEVTRAEVMNLFDALIANAENVLRDNPGTIRSILGHVIRNFGDEKLLRHVTDLRNR